MSTQRTKNQVYIDGIKQGNPKVIQQIYADFHQVITHLVETHNGTEDDAQDVFQEGLLMMYQKVQTPDFKLTSSFLTYFYAVCRNIWSNKLRKKSSTEVTFDNATLSMIEDEPVSVLEQNEQYFLYRKMFLRLGADCQKVLNLFLQKVKMSEIMQQMGYGSISYTKKRKFMCKKKLVQLIQNDSSFQELKSP